VVARRRSGLGKGLSSLIPNAETVEMEDGALRDLPIQLVRPNQFQPRSVFDDEALASLTASIRELGVLQPVLVRPVGDHFELIAGERRWRAAQAAGLLSVPALVRDVTDTTSLEQALVENLQRENLSPLEEAAAFQQLVDEFSLSLDAVGQRVGKSRSTVANAVRLLQLPGSIQLMINDRVLTAGHARALLSLSDSDHQEQLARRIVAEDLSVRATEEAARHAQAATANGAGKKEDGTIGKRPPGLLDLEDVLSEHLDTRVAITVGGKQRGRVTISFAGFEDLERICRVVTGGREVSP
jgi:ParB family chromosome partitioning protein